MSSSLDVETVCTDADLERYTLGSCSLQDLLPEEWLDEALDKKSAAPARQRALEEVLEALERRRPPIRCNDLTRPEELKTVVSYGALRILYEGAITHDESPHVGRAKRYAALYRSEMNSIQPTVYAGVTTSQLSVRMSRG